MTAAPFQCPLPQACTVRFGTDESLRNHGSLWDILTSLLWTGGCIAVSGVLPFGPGKTDCFRQVAALCSDHYRQVTVLLFIGPLYMGQLCHVQLLPAAKLLCVKYEASCCFLDETCCQQLEQSICKAFQLQRSLSVTK